MQKENISAYNAAWFKHVLGMYALPGRRVFVYNTRAENTDFVIGVLPSPLLSSLSNVFKACNQRLRALSA